MVGICEVPAAGKKWWGPDGTILDYPPLYTSGSSHRPGKDKKLYEMTWNVRRTSLGGGNSLVKFHVEGTVFTRGGSHGERYGDIMRRSYAQVYALDKSRREATAKLEVKVGDGEYRKVEFKNISLVPGEDRGFKIELGGKE